MAKICNNCKKQVDDNVNFCPYCKSQSFTNSNEIVTVGDNSLMHRLFYWNYDGYYMLSKSKLAGLGVFFVLGILGLFSGAPPVMIVVAIILALIVFLLFYAVHAMLPNPQKPKMINNDYGLVQDLKHFLFFWQNREGGFALSKTKIISHLVFVLFFLVGITAPSSNIVVGVLVGLFFEIPVFLVGYGVHKIINPNPEGKTIEHKKPKQIKKAKEVKKPKMPKIRKPKETAEPVFGAYADEVNDLKDEFDAKEKSTRDLIEKRFAPPQLTYTKFITVVDKSSKLFNEQASNALTMIELATDPSPKLENEIKSKIDILKTIIAKIDDLKNELVLNMGASDHEDVASLFGEMNDLIDSVKDYEQ